MSTKSDRIVSDFAAVNAVQKALDPHDAYEQLDRAATGSRKQSPQLRLVSVHVEEVMPGSFRWVLLEQETGHREWSMLGVAKESSGTWREALDDGCAALHLLTVDDRVGPRASEGERDHIR